MPAATATGAGNEPGEVAGLGTIDADLARRIIAHTATWTRVVTDPVDDAILAFDSHERYIPAALKRLIHLRMPTCAGDDCGLPAHRCDLDHIERVEHDGRTRHTNLHPLCRASHQGKDTGYLTVTMDDHGTPRWGNRWGGTRTPPVRFTIRQNTPKTYPDAPPF